MKAPVNRVAAVRRKEGNMMINLVQLRISSSSLYEMMTCYLYTSDYGNLSLPLCIYTGDHV